MTKAPIGSTVYFKKSCLQFGARTRDRDEPHTIVGYFISPRSGESKARLENGDAIKWGDLTDTPCSQMTCKRCKYHSRKPSRLGRTK